MLIWTAKFSRKKAALTVIAMGLVMAALIVLCGRTDTPSPAPLPTLTDNGQRVEYLQSLGWTVETEPVETLQLLLSDPLAEPYLSYNQMQLSQGFDLSVCCGKQVARYTYTVTNYPNRADGVQANLYICEDKPVAGDICCPGTDGFREPLISAGQPEE